MTMNQIREFEFRAGLRAIATRILANAPRIADRTNDLAKLQRLGTAVTTARKIVNALDNIEGPA